MNSFFAELKRRNVVRVAVAYVVVAWVILQFIDVIQDPLNLPGWFQTVTIVFLGIGFPIALIFSWAFEVTSEGVKKTEEVDKSKSITHGTGKRINKLIIGGLVLAVGFLLYDKFMLSPGEPVIDEARAAVTSIAVLPFVNMSNDPDQEFFSDGISEELLNVLAKYDGLRVAARTSSFQFKGYNRDITEIGQKLGVDYVLEGSVRKAGNTVRITAQLVETVSGFQMWSETYDRELVDVFAIQDEISEAIGNELRDKLALAGDDYVYATVAQATNPEAYEKYLLGKHLMNQRTRNTLEEAAGHFRTAIKLDPDYAPAYVNLAISYGLLTTAGGYGIKKPREALVLMEPLVDRAQALAPDLAETWGALYWVKIFQGKYKEAYSALDRAVELNPSYMGARIWKGLALGARQLYKEQREFSEESVRLDPLSLIHNNNLVEYLAKVGRYAEAKKKADLIYSIQPSWGRFVYGYLELEVGNIPGAFEHYLLGLLDDTSNTVGIREFRRLLSKIGFTEEARRFPDLTWADHVIFAANEEDLEAAQGVMEETLEASPDSPLFLTILAKVLYTQRDFEGAGEAFNKAWAQNTNPEIPLFYQEEDKYTYYAAILRDAGEEDAAAVQFAMALRGVGNMEAAGFVNWEYYQFKGLTLLYQGRNEEAIDALEKSFEVGDRDSDEFNKPLFDPVRDHPRFVALEQKYQTAKEENRAAVLKLICAGDLPDIGWQPLAETCEGVSQ